MARLNPQMLKSYMAKAQEDDDISSPDDETEGGSDYFEKADDDATEQDDDSGGYEGFMRLMFEHASELQTAANKVFLSVIDDELPEDTKDEIRAAIKNMPPELISGIKEYLTDLGPDQLHEMVEELEESGAIENDASVVPFLYWAARLS